MFNILHESMLFQNSSSSSSSNDNTDKGTEKAPEIPTATSPSLEGPINQEHAPPSSISPDLIFQPHVPEPVENSNAVDLEHGREFEMEPTLPHEESEVETTNSVTPEVN
jgi:hypothetical protein